MLHALTCPPEFRREAILAIPSRRTSELLVGGPLDILARMCSRTPVRAALINTLPEHRGRAAAGRWDNVESSLEQARADPRWVSRILTVDSNERCVAAAILHRLRDGAKLPKDFMEQMSVVADHMITRTLFLGGFYRGLGGGVACAGESVTDPLTWLRLITEQARATAEEEECHLAAIAVPDDQLGAVLSGWGRAAVVFQGGFWPTMDLNGARSREEFSARQSRRVQRLLNSDDISVRESGLVTTEQPLTTSLIQEAAPLISVVAQNNGLDLPARLAAFRLEQWSSIPGDYFAFVTRDEAGALLGASFGRIRDRVLQMADIGMRTPFWARRALYSQLMFSEPLRYACEHGLISVELGGGHPDAKALRGATIVPLWTIIDDETRASHAPKTDGSEH